MDARHTQIQTVNIEEGDDEVSLAKIFGTLWIYRRVIRLGIAAVMALFLVLALAGYLLLPRERLSSVGFRLVFDGVDKSQYPNETKFATSDIIATPVLAEVYDKDGLARYVGTFEKFKNSIFIRDANRDLELLDRDYGARLADAKLASVDRVRIETEYRDRRKSLTAPFYALTLRRNEWITAMPAAMSEKVLKDVLSTWAQQVDTRKGALKYNIPMYRRSTLPLDLIEKDDYLIAADVLRSKTLAIIDTVDQIGRLPGAAALRVGPDHISLGEIRAALADTLRFRLQPLIATITQTGATTDPRRLRAYVDNQLGLARERQSEQEKRVQTLQSSLASYTGEKSFAAPAPPVGPPRSVAADQAAVVPQVSESFLDRIMDLSKQNNDVEYRQEMTQKIITEGMIVAALGRDISYYEDLQRRLPAGGAAGNAAPLRAATKDVYEAVAKAVDQLNMFYAELSSQNLNAQSALYFISDPFSDVTQHALGLPAIVMYGALTLLLALFFVPIGCLVHHAAADSRRQSA